MTIKAKLFSISVLPAVLALLTSGVVVIAARNVGRVREKQMLAHEIMRGVFELDLLAYQYLQHPSQRAEKQWRQRHLSLMKLLVGLDFPRPEDRTALQQTRAGHHALGALFTDLVARHQPSPNSAGNGDLARELEQRLTSQFLARSHALVSQASRLASASNDHAATIEFHARWLVFLLVGSMAVVVAAVATWTSRSIFKPIEALRQGTEAIGSGNMEYKLEHDTGDEIGQLSNAFNDMTDRLQTVTVSRDELAREVQVRKHVESRLRSMTSELSLAEERERRRLATGLHDQIGQSLAMVQMRLGKLRQGRKAALAADWDQVHGLVDEAIAATRSLVFELGSPVLYELGLEAAIEELVQDMEQQHEIRCAFVANGQSLPVGEDVSVVLYRAVREVLLNTMKHAQAGVVRVSMGGDNDSVEICIEDDGVGFPVPKGGFQASTSGGYGLFSITERLEQMGGRLDVQSECGQGTCVRLVAPVNTTAEGQQGTAT